MLMYVCMNKFCEITEVKCINCTLHYFSTILGFNPNTLPEFKSKHDEMVIKFYLMYVS